MAVPMARLRTLIDKIIDPAVEKVAARKHFTKSVVMREVLEHNGLRNTMAEIRARYGEWKFDQVILKYTHDQIGRRLQVRDAFNLRVYGCYSVGTRERRWQRFATMNVTQLELMQKSLRTQAERLLFKAEGIQFFIDALREIGRYAKVEEVYEKVIPLILAQRNKAA